MSYCCLVFMYYKGMSQNSKIASNFSPKDCFNLVLPFHTDVGIIRMELFISISMCHGLKSP